MKQRYFVRLLVFAVLGLLSGCISLSGIFQEDRPIGSQYDDAGIRTTISMDLLKESPSQANNVNVYCYRGHVFLVGEADSGFRAFALEKARQVKGVVHVTTHWFPAGTGNSLEDSSLENTLRRKLDFAQSAPGAHVEVDVWDGHVVLTGLVRDQSQIDRSIAEVKKIKGVKSVTSYLALL